MQQLTPAERAAARGFSDFKDQYQTWTQSFDPVILPLFTKALGTARAAMGDFGPVIRNVGTSLQGFVGHLTDVFKSPAVKQGFADLGVQAKQSIGAIGSVVAGAIPAVLNLFKALTPLTTLMNRFLTNLGPQLPALAASLNAPFASLARSLTTLGPLVGALLKDVGKAALELLHAAEPLAAPLLRIVDALAKIIVTNAGPLLDAISGALAAMLHAVGPLLPAIGILVQALAGGLGKVLVALTPSLASLTRSLAEALVPLAPLIALVAGGLAGALTRVLPPVIGVANALLDLKGVFGTVGADVAIAVAAFEAYKVAMAVVGVATKVFAAAQALLNAVLDLNPIVIVVVALAALAAALVVAYQNSATFRAIVADVFSFLKTAAADVINALAAAWNTIFATVKTVWGEIEGFFKAWWPLILGVFTGGVGLLPGLLIQHWTTIRADVTSAWGAIEGVFRTVWNTIQTIVTGAVDGVETALSAAWGTIRGTVTSAWNAIRSVFTGAWAAISSTVSTGVAAVVRFMAALPGRVLSAVAGLVGSITSFGGQVIAGLAHGITAGAGAVWSFFASLPGRILGEVGNLGGLLVGAGAALIDGLAQGIEQAASSAASAVSHAVSGVVGAAKGLLGIHSPSTVFAQIGSFVMQGFASGITAGAPAHLTPAGVAAVVSLVTAMQTEAANSGNNIINALTAKMKAGALLPASVIAEIAGSLPAAIGDQIDKAGPLTVSQLRSLFSRLSASVPASTILDIAGRLPSSIVAELLKAGPLSVSALKSMIDSLDKTLAGAAASLTTGLGKQVTSLGTYVTSAKTAIDKSFAGTVLDQTIDRYAASFDRLSSTAANSLGGITTRLAAAQKALAAIQQQVASDASSLEGKYSVIPAAATPAAAATSASVLQVGATVASVTPTPPGGTASTDTSVTTGSINAALSQAVANLQQYRTLLLQLKSWGLDTGVLQQLVTAGATSGLSTAQALVAGGKSEVDLVDALQAQANDATAQLTAATTVAPLTAATTPAGVIANLQASLAQLQTYRTVLTSLKRMGLSVEILGQLVTAGPAAGLATAQALLAGGKSEVNLADALQGSIDSTATSVGTLSAAATLNGKTVGEGEVTGIIAGLDKQKTAVTARLRQLATDMRSAINDAMGIGKAGASALFSLVGSDTINGLVKGLADNKPKVYSELLSLAGSMKASIERALGIHSPSTVFAEIGSNVAAGLALGITSSAHLAASATDQLVADVTSSASKLNARVATLAPTLVGTAIAAPAFAPQITLHNLQGLDEKQVTSLVGRQLDQSQADFVREWQAAG